MATQPDTRNIVSRLALDRIAPDATPGTPTELKTILESVNYGVTPLLELRQTTPTADQILNIGNIALQDPNVSVNKTIPPISNLLPTFASGTVTFPTASGGSAVPSSGSSVVITMSNDSFLKVGIYLDPLGNLVIQTGAEGASEAAATVPPLVPSTHAIGFVVLETVVAVIQPITNSDIFQYVGGGAGGSGSGDASNVLTRLWDEFSDSIYQQLSGIDFSQEAAAGADGSSTGSYSLVSSTYELDATSETMVSNNLLSPDDFLTQGIDITEVSANVFWKEGLATDGNASYEVSRDGGNEYQTLTVTRSGSNGETFEGFHRFAEEASFATSIDQTTVDTSLELNTTSHQSLGQQFVVASDMTVKQLEFSLIKTGTPAGSFRVAIYTNSSGLPGTLITESNPVQLSSVSTGLVTVDLQSTLVPGTYHAVISTDATYKGSHDGSNFLASDVDGIGVGGSRFEGSVWLSAGVGLYLKVKGRVLDLRLRITASAEAASNTKQIAGYGAFYDPQSGVSNGVKNIKEFQFLSNSDNTDTFDLGFAPDGELLEVFHIENGQVYHAPAFTINGNIITFPANTFLQGSDETVTLIAKQTRGTSFDNSDSNAQDIVNLETNLLENPVDPSQGPVLATGVVAGAVSGYEEVTLTLDNELTAGTLDIVRVGKLVTATIKDWNFGGSNSQRSTTALIPAALRPALNLQARVDEGTTSRAPFLAITSGGIIRIELRSNADLSLSADTSASYLGSSATISWVLS